MINYPPDPPITTMNISSVIHVSRDSLTTALERKADNVSLSSKTLNKLQSVANREFGFNLGKVFTRKERLEFAWPNAKALAAAAALREVVVLKLKNDEGSPYMRKFLGQVLARLPAVRSTATTDVKADKSVTARLPAGSRAPSRTPSIDSGIDVSADNGIDGTLSGGGTSPERISDVWIPAPDYPSDEPEMMPAHAGAYMSRTGQPRAAPAERVPDGGAAGTRKTGGLASSKQEGVVRTEKHVRFDLDQNTYHSYSQSKHVRFDLERNTYHTYSQLD